MGGAKLLRRPPPPPRAGEVSARLRDADGGGVRQPLAKKAVNNQHPETHSHIQHNLANPTSHFYSPPSESRHAAPQSPIPERPRNPRRGQGSSHASVTTPRTMPHTSGGTPELKPCTPCLPTCRGACARPWNTSSTASPPPTPTTAPPSAPSSGSPSPPSGTRPSTSCASTSPVKWTTATRRPPARRTPPSPPLPSPSRSERATGDSVPPTHSGSAG